MKSVTYKGPSGKVRVSGRTFVKGVPEEVSEADAKKLLDREDEHKFTESKKKDDKGATSGEKPEGGTSFSQETPDRSTSPKQ